MPIRCPSCGTVNVAKHCEKGLGCTWFICHCKKTPTVHYLVFSTKGRFFLEPKR